MSKRIVRKTLKELTLLDKFLFDETMDMPEAHEAALRIILGQGKYCYTFVPCCKEDKELELKDGAVRIFLNTKGKNDEEVSQELRDFLRYIESVDGNVAENSKSENLKKIHACVNRIKTNEEMGVRYMQRWEEEFYWKEEGISLGIDQGRVEDIRSLMKTLGLSMEKAMEALEIPAEEQEKYIRLLKEMK